MKTSKRRSRYKGVNPPGTRRRTTPEKKKGVLNQSPAVRGLGVRRRTGVQRWKTDERRKGGPGERPSKEQHRAGRTSYEKAPGQLRRQVHAVQKYKKGTARIPRVPDLASQRERILKQSLPIKGEASRGAGAMV